MAIRATTASGNNLPRLSEVSGDRKKMGQVTVKFFPSSPVVDSIELPFPDRFAAVKWAKGQSLAGIYAIGGEKIAEVNASDYAKRQFKSADGFIGTICPKGERIREERPRNVFARA